MHRVEIKCFLNVLASISVAFILCMCGGTSWNCISEYLKYFLRSYDASLSMIWIFGVNPCLVNLS